MPFGKILRDLRGARSQEEMAKELGITKSALAMYERNERVPRDEVKVKIANYFNMSVQEIFYGDIQSQTCVTQKENTAI